MLPRWERSPGAGWLLPALIAVAWAATLAGAADEPLLAQRGVVFVGGPLLLLAGLHARLADYLHAGARARLLPLPVPAREHWRAAQGLHRRGLLVTGALGVLAIGLAVASSGAQPQRFLWLVGDFVWFLLCAALLESGIPGAAAWGGRRFPAGHWAHELQRQLGGGWTTPEAVVHLYAPAFGLGLAALLAMPGQLSFARLASGAALGPVHLGLTLGPLALALVARVVAPRLYADGLWRAVPRLQEAIRTLAGPPKPAPAPAWSALLGRLGGPHTRLAALQLARLGGPAPGLRLAALLLYTAYLALAPVPPDLLSCGLAVILAAAWIAAGLRQRQERARNRRLLAHLPLPAPARAGRAPLLDALIFAPPALTAVALTLRWTLAP